MPHLHVEIIMGKITIILPDELEEKLRKTFERLIGCLYRLDCRKVHPMRIHSPIKNCDVRISDKLEGKSREELLKIFKEEVLSFNEKEFLKNLGFDEARLSKCWGYFFALTLQKAEARGSGEVEKIKEIDKLLRKIRKELKVAEQVHNLTKLVNKYRVLYEEKVEEGFGTTQKIDSKLLIRAIDEVRAYKKTLQFPIRGESHLRPRPYRYPYDWAGYSIHKYPPSIGLDPDKVKCSNCRHWDEKEKLCLILRKRTNPDYRCADFGRRGL
jgi:hypothetical protein